MTKEIYILKYKLENKNNSEYLKIFRQMVCIYE